MIDSNEALFMHSLLSTFINVFETNAANKDNLIEKVYNLLLTESYDVSVELFKVSNNNNSNQKNFSSLQEKYRSCFEDSLYFDQHLSNGRYGEDFIEKDLIGRGGFGQVFKVSNKLDKNDYALKKVRIIGEEINEALNEIEIWASLKSEFIVDYKSSWIEDIVYKYDYRYDDDDSVANTEYESDFKYTTNYTLFIQMELCDTTFGKLMQELNAALHQSDKCALMPIGVYIACQLFLEVVEGLDYLHSQRPPLIHRDIKPSNILVKQHSKNAHFIKICDFGLTTYHKTHSMSHTQGKGTYPYIAPEVDDGRDYNEKSDIFSFGILMEEILVNRSRRNSSFSTALSIGEPVNSEHCAHNEINDYLDNCCFEKMRQIFTNILTLQSQDSELRPSSSEILNRAENFNLSFDDIKSCSQLTEFIYDCYTNAPVINHLLNQIFLKHLKLKVLGNNTTTSLESLENYFKSNISENNVELVLKKKVLHAINICDTALEIKHFLEESVKNWKCLAIPVTQQQLKKDLVKAASKHFIDHFLYYDINAKLLLILIKRVDVFQIDFIIKRRAKKINLTFNDIETEENITTLIDCLNESDNLDISILKNNQIFGNICLYKYLKKASSVYYTKHKLFILTVDRALYYCDSLLYHVNEIEIDSREVAQIVYNGNHVMIVMSGGSVLSWGRNRYGQLGNGTAINNNDPKVIISLKEKIIVKVCSSYEHSVGLTSDGSVYAWGHNNYGQLGCVRSQDQLSPVRINFPKGIAIMDISCGSYHTFALSTNGQLFSWGLNSDGQLGFEDKFDRKMPTLVDSNAFRNKPIIKVLCEQRNSFILSNDGNVYGTGILSSSAVFRQINRECDRFIDIFLNKSYLLVALSINEYCYVYGFIKNSREKLFIPYLTFTTFKSIHNCFFVFTESQYTHKPLLMNGMSNQSEHIEHNMIKKLKENIFYNPYIALNTTANIDLPQLLQKTLKNCISFHSIKLGIERLTPFRCYFLNSAEQSIEQFASILKENQFECIIIHEQSLEVVIVLFDYIYYRIIDFCAQRNNVLIDIRRIDYFSLIEFQQNFINFGEDIIGNFDFKNWSVFRDMSLAELKSIKLYAIDYERTFFITKDDKVFSLGDNHNGCLGIETDIELIATPHQIKELCNKNIVKFVFACDYMAALTTNGTVFTWGNNFKGQLCHKDENKCFKPKPINISIQIRVKNLYCGPSNMLILTESDNLFIVKNNVTLEINYRSLERIKAYDEKKNFFCSNNQNIFLITEYYLYIHDIARHDYRFYNLEQYQPLYVVNVNCCSMPEFKSLMLSATGDIYEITFSSVELNKEYKLEVRKINDNCTKFEDICYSKSTNTFVALSTNGNCFIMNDKVVELTETPFTRMDNALAVYSEPQVTNNQNIELAKCCKLSHKKCNSIQKISDTHTQKKMFYIPVLID